MVFSFAIFGVLAIIVLGYGYFKSKFSYWERRGVPFVKPVIPYGNLKGIGKTISNCELMWNSYNEHKGKGAIVGMYFFSTPVVLVVDLDFLKQVFVKDYAHFQGRGMYVNERDDPLSAHLFSLEGEQWKNIRSKLSPTFSSGKMKMMHPTILQVAGQFTDHLLQLTNEKRIEVEIKHLLAQFTTDVIGNVAFGIECNCLKDPDNEFIQAGKKVFESSPLHHMKAMFVRMFPSIGKRLRIMLTNAEATNFIMTMLRNTIKYREENNIQRNDFMSLLLQIKNTGKLEGVKEDLGKMTFNELAAQVFGFFIAGFETSSSTMTFALYELALNPDIQEQAREEVREVLQRYDGELTYEAAMELTFIDQVINETLRKYPVVDTLFRKVTIPYKVPGTEVVLEKDTPVFIPVMGFHRDPEIYPNPDKFDPERFTKENVAARHPYAWMPFGDGPRNCIGLRFGMMQTRLGIATILNNFKITPSKNTMVPIKFDVKGHMIAPEGGIKLNIEKLK